jgi:hypothetical protein
LHIAKRRDCYFARACGGSRGGFNGFNGFDEETKIEALFKACSLFEEIMTKPVKKKLEFVPVNSMAEPCECCTRNARRRGVRVEDVFGTFYYCDACITKLAKAKAS